MNPDKVLTLVNFVRLATTVLWELESIHSQVLQLIQPFNQYSALVVIVWQVPGNPVFAQTEHSQIQL